MSDVKIEKNRILTELPMWKSGNNEGHVNWKETVGMELELLYKRASYKVKVIKYEKGKLWIDYNGYIYKEGISCNRFKNGKFGRILKIFTNDFRCEIGQSFQDDKRDLIIIDREYREKIRKDSTKENEKWYKYTCNKCGWSEGWIKEGSLLEGNGCSCCYGRTAVLGINTIWDTDRWMCDLGVSEEDAKRYTKGSNKKIKIKCPYCGKKKKIAINITHRTKIIGCTNCGDGVSYPEKIAISILNQLRIDHKPQLSNKDFAWCDKYKYDFYIPSLNMIIETHGGQHYKEQSIYSRFKRTLQEEQENDRIKKELALTNGIKHYIELDCRYSDLDYIRNSILNSKLNELFNLTNVSWFEAEEFAINSNKVKEVCDYWNSKEEWETVNTIANNNEWGITARGTIRDYLKKGTKYEWCNYDPKEELRKGSLKGWVSRCNIYEAYDLSNNFVASSHSAMDLAKKIENILNITNVSSGAIIEACKGRRKTHKGLRYTCNKKITK